jgi:UDP-N-acetylglucosamine 2-epimerase (non-hydrolysing)
VKKILIVFGTRPEAIKVCPVIKELYKRKNMFETHVCVTGQHIQMLNQVLDVFNIKPDYNLSIMTNQQTLFDVTIKILDKIKIILDDLNPDLVIVHGDTTTTFATSLAAFYNSIPVGHIEAGLRTNNIYSPFPEEFNRQAVGIIAKYNFAPTLQAKNNLLRESKDPSNIFVTGNTAIDALKYTVRKKFSNECLKWAENHRLLLITAHRRENIGEPMEKMFRAILRIVNEFEDVKAIYPVHLNPKVKKIATDILGNKNRIKLVEPMDVVTFHNILARSFLILTDSGGIQEEAPSLGKPVLVMRDTTERPEGIKAGTLKLVGTSEEGIYANIKYLLHNKDEYIRMSKAVNPFGDGKSSQRIVDILEKNIQ